MERPQPIRPPQAVSLLESLLVLAATFAASVVAICWSWTHKAFLLYGDAEAHIHIARRLFDSHRPGITQLGSVWLPLPPLLLAPFVLNDSWWKSGFAAAIPSAIYYLLACSGLYTLARKWLSPAAAALSLGLFAANPNLLYLQTTAMTEPLFLCELIWTMLLLVNWHESLDGDQARAGKLLWAVIGVLVAAVYTRYDGWILAFLAWVAMAVCLARRGRLLRIDFLAASFVLLLAPAGWMIYNAVVFGDWLDFARGPYSAHAIELRTASSAFDPHPGWHNPWVAFQYFTEAAELDADALHWGWLLFGSALVGTGSAWFRSRASFTGSTSGFLNWRSNPNWLWALLLWLPLPFYAYSVSYGSVPIFIPAWTPFSWYNTRYGMELLPAFALFFGFAVEGVLAMMKLDPAYFRNGFIRMIAIVLTANVAGMLRLGPLTYIEAQKNDESRHYYNTVLADALRQLHTVDPNGIVLMDTGNFPSIVPHAGLTYRETVNESDKEFYWAALGAPASHADIVLAFAGDEIDKAVRAHPEHLIKYQAFRSGGNGWDQADATIYVAGTFPQAQPSTPASTVPAR